MSDVKIVVVGVGKAGNAVVNHLVANDDVTSENLKYIYVDDADNFEESDATTKIKLDYVKASKVGGKRKLEISKFFEDKKTYRAVYEKLKTSASTEDEISQECIILKDVHELTVGILDKLIFSGYKMYSKEKGFGSSAKTAFKFYKALEQMIHSINRLSETNLALTFNERFLNNDASSPIETWKAVFSKDLNNLNTDIVNYLKNLVALENIENFDEETGAEINHYSCTEKLFKLEWWEIHKHLNSRYSIGSFKDDTLDITLNIISIQDDYQYRKYTIDLFTYESRLLLQNELRKKKQDLKKQLGRLRRYIVLHYTIDDIL